MDEFRLVSNNENEKKLASESIKIRMRKYVLNKSVCCYRDELKTN